MQQWEYSYESFRVSLSEQYQAEADMDKVMVATGRLGAQGWELVATELQGGMLLLMFKRPKQG